MMTETGANSIPHFVKQSLESQHETNLPNRLFSWYAQVWDNFGLAMCQSDSEKLQFGRENSFLLNQAWVAELSKLAQTKTNGIWFSRDVEKLNAFGFGLVEMLKNQMPLVFV